MKHIVWITWILAGATLIINILLHPASANDDRYTVEQPVNENWGNETDLTIQNIRGPDGQITGQINTYTAPETGYTTQEIIPDPYYIQE